MTVSDRKAAGFSADEGNDAERAARIATVLDFESGASVIPFSAEDRSDEDVGEFERCRRRGSARWFAG